MSFSRVIDINSNLIKIDIGHDESQIRSDDTTKLVNVKTNDSFFFKSIKGDLGSTLDPKYREMTKYNDLYVDNNNYYQKVLSITKHEIEVENGYGQSIKISCLGRNADATEMVNIKSNHSFFFKSIQDDSGTHLDPEIYTMIELENLYIKGQPPVKPKSSFFNFLGGRKSRKQRNIKL